MEYLPRYFLDSRNGVLTLRAESAFHEGFFTLYGLDVYTEAHDAGATVGTEPAEVIQNTVVIGDMSLYELYVDDGTRKPVVILIHGDNTSGPLNALKCWAATVTQIDAVLDLSAAVSQADTERVGIAGRSMGGTICFAYAAHGKYTPDVIVPVSGTPDYTQMSDSPLYDRYGSGEPAEAFMTREEILEFAAEYSPVNHPERFLNTYIYAGIGTEDTTASPKGLKKLESALRELGGTKFVFNYYEGFGHEDLPDFNADGALRQILLSDESEPVFD